MSTLQENQSLNAEYERNKKEREMKDEIERLQEENTILKQTMCNNNLLINKNALLNSIIKEAREYITSYESIDTIQQSEIPKNNIGLDEDTIIEMVRRYMIVHDKVLEILDKVEENK